MEPPKSSTPGCYTLHCSRVSDKIEFTGYIVSPSSQVSRQAVPSLRKKVLITMGGGEDGSERVETYIAALLIGPTSWDSHIVTGPLMSMSQVRHFKRMVHKHGLAGQVRISRFSPKLQRQLQQSDAVVSMAGYNSCAEIMKSGIPAVLMPRLQPRKEQLIRAQRLEELGLVKCVIDGDSKSVRIAVETALEQGDKIEGFPDLNGLESLCRLIGDLIKPEIEPRIEQGAQSLRAVAE